LGPEQDKGFIDPQNDIEQVKARLQALIDDDVKLTSLCEVLKTERALKREMLQMDEETKAKKTKEETNPKKVRANHMPANQNTGVEYEAHCPDRTSDESESIIANTPVEQEEINRFIDDGKPHNNDPHLHRELDNLNFQNNDSTGYNISDCGQEFDDELLQLDDELGVGGDDEVLDNLNNLGDDKTLDLGGIDEVVVGVEAQGLLNKHTTGDWS